LFTLRLYLDGGGQAWALVQCENCNEVRKYPAEEALDAPIQCADCNARMDVGEKLLAELTAHRKAFARDPSDDGRGTAS
jgi:hypothetical protein